MRIGKGIFHPVESSSWPEFMLGSIIAGLLLGVGLAVGNNLVARYAPPILKPPHEHPQHPLGYDFE